MHRTDSRRDQVPLTVSSPNERAVDEAQPQRMPYLPWLGASLLGSAGALLVGWLAVAVVVLVGWLTATNLPFTGALDASVQGWLLIHGVPAQVGDIDVSIVPLGWTLLVVAALSVSVHGASVQMGSPEDGAPQRPWVAVALLAGVSTLSYSLLAFLMATIVASTAQATHMFVGAFGLALVTSVFSAIHARWDEVDIEVPVWLAALPRAIAAGLGTMVIAAVMALTVAVVAHWPTITSIHASLKPDVVGSILLFVLYLAYLPNALLWAGSYALGAGFAVGTGTFVTPMGSVLASIPAIPLFGAIPTEAAPAGWAWILSGVVAGAVAATVQCRQLQASGEPDLLGWAWQSAVAGGLAGVVWTILARWSSGGLGTGRLAVMGPQLTDLILFAIVLVTLVAGVTGLSWAWHAENQADHRGDAEVEPDTEVEPGTESDTEIDVDDEGETDGADDEETTTLTQ